MLVNIQQFDEKFYPLFLYQFSDSSNVKVLKERLFT